jgi:putative intracellular protease/amidase
MPSLHHEHGRVRRLARATAALLVVASAGAALSPALSAQPAPRRLPAPLVVDFDAAMRGLNFPVTTTDATPDGAQPGNRMIDTDEFALIAAILANPSLDFRKTGGVDHVTVRAAFEQARASAVTDLAALTARYPTAPDVAAGYAMLGAASHTAFSTMTTSFGAPLKGTYALAAAVGVKLAHDGDADGDGVSNRAEYLAQIAKGRAAYVAAALNPTIRDAGTGMTTAAAPVPAAKKTLGIVLYPGFEVLDVYGPLEMFAYVPDFRIVMISETGGAVRSAQGVSTMTDFSFATAPPLDIMMVPGGAGTFTQLNNAVLLDYLRAQNQRTELTASVCTGSALLAKAGILRGHRATTNKAYFSLSVDQDPTVNWITSARWVEDGKMITSSGVSAGTDMALGLIARYHGKEHTQHLARSLEYIWHENADDDPFAITTPVQKAATPVPVVRPR